MKSLFLSACMALSALVSAQNYTVITYNIRYDNGHDGEDNWKFRKAKVAAIINDNNADIVGLQEVLVKQLTYLKGELNAYNYVGVGREDGKNKGEFSPIFYKKDKFTLIDKGWFWLSETPAKPGKGWDAACPRICTWAVLRDTATKQQLFVFNTHLDHKGLQARKNGISLIVDSLQSKMRAINATHALFMGDFNFTPENANYQAVTGMQDSYTLTTPQGTVGTTNSFNPNGEYKNRIDYVWVADFEVDSYRVLNDKLPNGRWPSDHFPVMVKVHLNSTK